MKTETGSTVEFILHQNKINSNANAALFSKQVRNKNELVVGQTAFTCSDQVKEIWQQIICTDMFL